MLPRNLRRGDRNPKPGAVLAGCPRPKALRFANPFAGGSLFGDGMYSGNIVQGGVVLQPQPYLLHGVLHLDCIVITGAATVAPNSETLTAYAQGQELVLAGASASLRAGTYCKGLVLAFRRGVFLTGGATLSMTGLGYPGAVDGTPVFADCIPSRHQRAFKTARLNALVPLAPVGAAGGATTPSATPGHTGGSGPWLTGGGGSGGTDSYGGSPSGGAGAAGTCFCGGSGGGGGANSGGGTSGGDAQAHGGQGGSGGVGVAGGVGGAGGGAGRPVGTATTNPGALGAGGFLALLTPYLYGDVSSSIQAMGMPGGDATPYCGPGAGSGGGVIAVLTSEDAFAGSITCAGGASGALSTRSLTGGAGGVGYISRQTGLVA